MRKARCWQWVGATLANGRQSVGEWTVGRDHGGRAMPVPAGYTVLLAAVTLPPVATPAPSRRRPPHSQSASAPARPRSRLVSRAGASDHFTLARRPAGERLARPGCFPWSAGPAWSVRLMWQPVHNWSSGLCITRQEVRAFVICGPARTGRPPVMKAGDKPLQRSLSGS